MEYHAERDRLNRKAGQLLRVREQSWLAKWKDMRDNIAPNDGQFDGDMPNDGKRKDHRINNPKPIRTAQRLAAGMTSGMASQSRPWFELSPPNGVPETAEVRRWLYLVQQAIMAALAKSNFYNILPQVFHSQGVYGTAAMAALPHAEDVVRFYHYPVGTFCIDTNADGRVDTFYREYTMTARQMIQQFGKENVSEQVKLAAEQGNLADLWVRHLVEPNPDADMQKVDNLRMPWRSTYWEKGATGGQRCGILRQSGFNNFPVMAPRWDVNGVNVYGTGPGDIALGKCRELQLLERDKMRLVQHLAQPNRTAPISLKASGGANIVPGGISWVPDNLVGLTLQPTYVPDPAALPNLRAEITEAENDIGEAFFEDLFLIITQNDGTMTAYEVAQRKEEKMQMLGPVVERNNDELFDPAIGQTFSILYEQSLPRWQGLLEGAPLIPPPPEELQGSPLRVEYISILAQAQKAVAVSSIERAAQFTGMLMQTGFADAADKFNPDAAQDAYYTAIGAPPTILRSGDEVAALRQARADQIQQQQAMEQGAALAQGAKTLAETPTTGDTALTALLGGGANG